MSNWALFSFSLQLRCTLPGRRAVLLTSLTTILGLSPLLYERGDELIFLVPFVVSMLGGLVFATLATLLLLPTLVMVVEGRKE